MKKKLNAVLAVLFLVLFVFLATHRKRIAYYDVQAAEATDDQCRLEKPSRDNPFYLQVDDRLYLQARVRHSFVGGVTFYSGKLEKFQWELDEVFGERPGLLAKMPDADKPMYGIKWLKEREQ